MKPGHPPRVLIDGRLLETRGGGIARYTAELARALPSVAHDLDLGLLVRHGSLDVADLTLPTIQTRTPPHHRLERWSLGLEASLRRPNLLHSPDFIQPIVPFRATVITIHDLAFLEPAGEAALTAGSFRYYRQVVRLASQADRIIAVSNYVKQSIIDRLGVPEARVRTIYNGVTLLRSGPPEGSSTAPLNADSELPQEVRAAIERQRPIILMVGTVEPRKRHDLLLDALEIIRSRQTGQQPFLVVIGAEGWNCGTTASRLRALNSSGDGCWCQDAGDRLLGQALRHATLLAMPSRDEGFGLPVLEAMAAELPVVAAARGALPEIAADAALLVRSDDPEEWSVTIDSLITDEPRRHELRQAGLRRAAEFSWGRTASETAQLYREVLAR